MEYDRNFRSEREIPIRSESGIPIGIDSTEMARSDFPSEIRRGLISDEFPINFLIGFNFQLKFPSEFWPLSGRILVFLIKISDLKSYQNFGLGKHGE